MRRDELYLRDIVEAADAIATFVRGCDASSFSDDDLVRSAVLHKLTLIGEAAGRFSGELTSRHPEVPWREIVAFRNIAVHEYFALNWAIVWAAASVDVPLLREQIAGILAEVTSEGGGPEAFA